MDKLAIDEGVLVVGDALDQIAVVAHDEQRTGPRIEQGLELGEHIGIEVVPRLIEDEHVGAIEQNEHELQTALLPTRKVTHGTAELICLETQLLE